MYEDNFSIPWSNLCAKLPFINDCQKSVCHFTDAKIQYAFLHKMPFYTKAFLHYCLLTPLPIYTTAFLHYCQYTGEPKLALSIVWASASHPAQKKNPGAKSRQKRQHVNGTPFRFYCIAILAHIQSKI